MGFLNNLFKREPTGREKLQLKLNRANKLANIINTTYDFDEFLNSFNELIEILKYLQILEDANFFTGSTPSKDLADINRKRPITEKEFIDRFISKNGKEKLRDKIGYLDKFSLEATNYVNKNLGNTYKNPSSKIKYQDYDNMDGHQFEYFCADLLRKNGFINVEVTKGSGDHGIDILTEKDGITYAIQCKCYSSDIGNSAVQQAHTGKSIYKRDIAVVLTNRYFTAQAKEEAAALSVKLWDRGKLNEMIGNND